MKTYIIRDQCSDPSDSNFLEISDALNKLGYSVTNFTGETQAQEIMEAELVIHFDSSDLLQLGIALGDYFARQGKTILQIVSEKNRCEEAQPYIKYFRTFDQCIADYLLPNSPLKRMESSRGRGSAEGGPLDGEMEEILVNNKRMLRILSLAYYPYLTPDKGENVSIEILDSDVDKLSHEVSVKLELTPKSLKLYYKGK